MPQTREERLARNRAFYVAHKAEIAAKVRAYQSTHTEERAASNRAYRATHKAEIATKSRAHYAAHKAAIGAKARAYRSAHKAEIQAKNRAYYAAHTEELTAKQRAYAAAHKQEIRIQKRAYHAANKQAIAAKNQGYAAAYREELAAWRRAYHAAHPELAAVHRDIRRARKAGVTVNDFTAAQWREILVAYGHRCVYCDRKMQRLTQDHIVPLAKGGMHTFSNIVPACKSCNSKKGARAPLVPVQPLLLTVSPAKPYTSRKKVS